MNSTNSSLWPWIVGAVLFTLSNAILVAMELALLRVCLSHFEPELETRLREKPATRKLVDNAEGTVRLLRTASFLSVAGFSLMIFNIAHISYERAAAQWNVYMGVWIALLALVIGCGIFVLFGVLLPRVVGLSSPERVIVHGRRALIVFMPLDRLVVTPMRLLIDKMMRLVGVRDDPGLDSLDFEEQIEHSGKGKKPMPAMAQRIFRNAMQMRGLNVSDVFLPRTHVVWMDSNDSDEVNLRLARETGHTRFPLCNGDLDRCIGLIHIKDVFRHGANPRKLDLRRLKRDILRISPDTSVENAMQMLLSKRQHMALVVDEFRGAEGIVTLERLLELLVGDIHDEFDVENDNMRLMPNGEYSVSGLTPVYELERALEMEFQNRGVATLGGLITTELGRIPSQGERLKLDGLDVIVTEVDPRRVIRARIRRNLPPEAEA